MQKIRQIGNVTWNTDDIKAAIPEFLELNARRPLNDNEGGMKAPHMFATWFMLRKLNPANVIESGIWKGQGTWLIENTLPNARLYSIDVDLGLRKYISDKATYFEKDFSAIDWSIISDKENTVLFFDDHQNAVERVRQGKSLGFRNFIFEDNYPARQGDCYSLKKAFQNAGFDPNVNKKGLRGFFKRILHPQTVIRPNTSDGVFLENNLEIYYEFPPVFRKDHTRWNDAWSEADYPTPEPVYKEVEQDYLQLFYDEAIYYTWICYARLKA